MSDRTGISYLDATWSPVTGCTPCSPGCAHCWAKRMHERFARYRSVERPAVRATTVIDHDRIRPRRFEEVCCHEDRLEQPLHWRKPRRVGVAFMGDLFHPDVPGGFIDQVVAYTQVAYWHAYFLLTKRTERARAYFSFTRGRGNVLARVLTIAQQIPKPRRYRAPESFGWPYRNLWLGFTAETQVLFDARWQDVGPLAVAGWHTWWSGEPLLAAVDPKAAVIGAQAREVVRRHGGDPNAIPDGPLTPPASLGWLVLGGENCHDARPCDVEWLRLVVRRAEDAGLPCFVKQLGSKPVACSDCRNTGLDSSGANWCQSCGGDAAGYRLKNRAGSDPSEWPSALRVQQLPEVRR